MGSKRKWEVPSLHTVWEFDEDAPVGAEAEAIAAELLEAGAIVGGDPDVGVQVEAVEVAWRGPREVRCPRSGSSPRRTRAPALGPRATRPWTEALTEPGQDGRGLGERVGGLVCRLELAAGEQPSDPGTDGGQDVRHVVVARWGRGVKR
jgi:hypothetical protein